MAFLQNKFRCPPILGARKPKGPKEVLAFSPARWHPKKMPVLSVQKINKDNDLVKRLKVPREYRGTSLITSDFTVGPYGRLCLGPYGGPRGEAVGSGSIGHS